MPSVMNKILGLSAYFGLYDKWAERRLGQVHDTLIELAAPRGNAEILDIGCGTGILSCRLAGIGDGYVVHGVDVSPCMIRVAQKRGKEHCPRAQYQVGTAVRLPYSDGQFDLVCSCLLFHLLEDSDKEQALREVFRVLRPGGRYVCAEFEEYPVQFWGGKLARYPGDLIGIVGFDVHTKASGPSITRSRPIVYRVLVRQ